MADAETPHELVLVNRYDASPQMFFTRLGEFLAR